MDSKRIARYIVKLFGTAIAVYVAAWILPGIKVDSIGWAIVVSFVLGLLNSFIKPLLTLIAIPFILVTFGLFLVVINAVLLMFTGDIVPDNHFYVEGFWPAVWGSVIISIVSGLLEPRDRKKDGEGGNGGVNIRIERH
ncbi:MAG TPA: phage holin family protein [Bacteroidia bacterium]|nr:phage holin family protein [Bacteroidia bacterium]